MYYFTNIYFIILQTLNEVFLGHVPTHFVLPPNILFVLDGTQNH